MHVLVYFFPFKRCAVFLLFIFLFKNIIKYMIGILCKMIFLLFHFCINIRSSLRKLVCPIPSQINRDWQGWWRNKHYIYGKYEHKREWLRFEIQMAKEYRPALGKGRRYCVHCPRTSRYRIKQKSFSNERSWSKLH